MKKHTSSCTHNHSFCGKGDGHHHHHHGHHSLPKNGKKLFWVVLLNALITAVEIVGGLLSNSLSLLSDAVHNLGDTLAIAFAYVAGRIGKKRADIRYTFGYKRAEILAAFINASLLIAICLFLLKEAYERWQHPEVIAGKLMLVVSVIGLLANLLSVVLLHKEKDENINTRAAYLHLLGDTLSSVAVIAGGVAIWLYDFYWLDPLITVFVSVYIMHHTWGVLKEAIDILMQTAPNGVDIPQLVSQVESIPNVVNIHHLHLWQLHEGQTHFEAHIAVEKEIDMLRLDAIRQQVRELLEAYGIHHSTLQLSSNCCAVDAALIVEDGCSA